VDSRPGQGSRFWFSANLYRHDGPLPAPVSRGEPAAETALRERFAGTRLLLAEDHPINQEITLGLLEDVGLTADLADHGEAAVDAARRQSYPLILMDMQMPRLDGLGATRQIRQLPGYATTPIVAMTANVMQEDQERCRLAGMDDHLAKPIETAVFYATIYRWLSAATAPERRPAATPGAAPAADGTPGASADGVGAHLAAAGVNLAEGLKRTRGRLEKLEHLLRLFVEGHRQSPAAIGQALADSDHPAARHLAHSLKGLASQLAVSGMADTARQLEIAIDNPLSDCAPLLAQLDAQFERLAEAL